jgi:hypothetical protein
MAAINSFVATTEIVAAVRTVVIHVGGAHEDEILGTALILAKTSAIVRVERRDPTTQDLADPTVVVLDVGKQYAPELSNLDHHQDATLPCAAVLAARWLGIEAEILGAFPALALVDKLDRTGPMAVAKELGVAPKLIFDFQSPLAGAVKSMIEKVRGALPPHLVDLLRDIGLTITGQAERFGRDLAALKALQTFEVKGLKAVRLSDELRGTPALQEYLDSSGVNIFINRGRDNASWQVTRVNDHPKVDFRRLKGGPIVTTFVHANGFTAAVVNESDIRPALEAAIEA